MAAALVVTAWWAYVLLGRSAGLLPWLRPLVLVCGLAAAVVVIAERWLPGRAVLLSVAPLALVAGLAGPLAYSIDTAATSHTGALPSAGPLASFGGPGGGFGGGRPGGGRPGGGFGAPGSSAQGGTSGGTRPPGQHAGRPGGSTAGHFPGSTSGRSGQLPGGRGGGIGGALGGNTQVSSAITKLLTSGATGYRWAAATVGAESAAPFQLASGEPLMAIGGFNGTDQTPSLAQFKQIVAAGEVHYFIGSNGHTFGGGSGDAARSPPGWSRTSRSRRSEASRSTTSAARPAPSRSPRCRAGAIPLPSRAVSGWHPRSPPPPTPHRAPLRAPPAGARDPGHLTLLFRSQ